MKRLLLIAAVVSGFGSVAIAEPVEGNGPSGSLGDWCEYSGYDACYYEYTTISATYWASGGQTCYARYYVDVYRYECQSNGAPCTYRDKDPDPFDTNCN
jgi:hypothetical protein